MCHAYNEKGKSEATKEIELLNQKSIRTFREKKEEERNENYQYVGIFEMFTIKHIEMKEKARKKQFRRSRKM